jgi:hypothetical protein
MTNDTRPQGPPPSEPVILRNATSFAFVRYLCTAFAAAGLAFSLIPSTKSGVPAWAFGLPMAGLFAAAGWRAAKRGVFVDASGVRARNFLTTTSVPWENIERFEVGPFFGEWQTVVIRTSSGSRVHLQALATRNPDLFRGDAEPARSVRTLETWLEEAKDRSASPEQ